MSIDVANASGHVLDQSDTTAIQCFLSSLSNLQGMVQSSTSTGASDGNTSSGASDSSEVRPGESQSPAALMSSLTGLFASTSASSFPHELDYSQPAKSWWRYFQKQTVTNTAQCYSCGQVFNRGPKQSTTSLSHHLKMYHREMFIAIQQAKDDELRSNGKAPRAELQPLAERERRDSEELNESVLGKKTAFNMKLIGIVKEFPEIYDPKQRAATEGDDRGRVWETVAQRLGEGVTPELSKKRWLQIRDRYRKELKFAIRDNFSYTPKWPYFRDLTWLDEFLKDSCSVPIPRRPHLQRKRPAEESGDANGSCFLDENSTDLIASFINACNSPQVLELTAKHSPDSAIASTSDEGECTKEHNVAEPAVKEENSPLNELDMTSTTTLLALQQFLASASESSAIPQSPHTSSTLPTTPKKARPASAVPAKASVTKPEPVENGAKEPAASANSFEYLKDEDSLFGRIVALRLKGFSIERKHLIKVAIEQLFEKHEREVILDSR